MKRLISLLTCTLLYLGAVQADELQDAYNKEYTFLKAQKDELHKRLDIEQKQQNQEIAKAEAEVQTLQNNYVALSRELTSTEQAIEQANRTFQSASSNKEIVGSVVTQSGMTLLDYGIEFKDQNTTELQKIEEAFDAAAALYQTLSSIRKESGSFFLLDGTTAEGDIVKVGNIAAYGLSAKASGALSPAGNGSYKLWNQPGSDIDAKAFFNGQMPSTVNIFVYENMDREVDYQHEKTLDDVLRAGGPIGYTILTFGAFGLLLILLRTIFLLRSGSSTGAIAKIVSQKLESETPEAALDAIANFHGATARVIKATLRNIKKERDHIEDIITESMLNEQSTLDRFGSVILVIASVAPLLGLLGTVTGMIATFDVITEHGTSDPKLLAGGISEALVTTEFGLIVAIPLLLLGNLLGGWASNIKDSMEQYALNIVNTYEKHKSR